MEHPNLFYSMDGLFDTKISQSVHPTGMVISPITLADNFGAFDKDSETCLLLGLDNNHDDTGLGEGEMTAAVRHRSKPRGQKTVQITPTRKEVTKSSKHSVIAMLPSSESGHRHVHKIVVLFHPLERKKTRSHPAKHRQERSDNSDYN